MMSNNLVDNLGQRALWIAKVHGMITICLELETAISITMTAYPTAANALELISADSQLGVAVSALGEAAARIARLKP